MPFETPPMHSWQPVAPAEIKLCCLNVNVIMLKFTKLNKLLKMYSDISDHLNTV